jgi:hypothetical protein
MKTSKSDFGLWGLAERIVMKMTDLSILHKMDLGEKHESMAATARNWRFSG